MCVCVCVDLTLPGPLREIAKSDAVFEAMTLVNTHHDVRVVCDTSVQEGMCVCVCVCVCVCALQFLCVCAGVFM